MGIQVVLEWLWNVVLRCVLDELGFADHDSGSKVFFHGCQFVWRPEAIWGKYIAFLGIIVGRIFCVRERT